jgi:CRISPR-associated endonuclease/helicase Cas3
MHGLPDIADLWGKLRNDPGLGPAWHPLVDHSIDVAAVLETLLRTPRLRARLARAGGVEVLDDRHIERLCFLAFIHDLGKCSLGFRAKAVPELGRPSGHLQALKPLFGG